MFDIICPHCGEENNSHIYYSGTTDDGRYIIEHECGKCQELFKVVYKYDDTYPIFGPEDEG